MATASDLLSQFRDLFPEFSDKSDIEVTKYLTIALAIFSKCPSATLWLAAFLIDEAGNSGGGGSSAGQITKMQVDSKMVEFAQIKSNSSNPSDSQYLANEYGRNYLRLKDVCLRYRLAGGVFGNGC